MNPISIDRLRSGVAEYMGLKTMPMGNQSVFDSSIKSGIDYCWRYVIWNFAVKRGVELTPKNDATGNMHFLLPTDFDILGWRQFSGVDEWSTQDADEFEKRTRSQNPGVWIEWYDGESRFEVKSNSFNLADTTVSYAVRPPELTDVIFFPSAEVICLAASIYSKMKDMPNSHEISQQWDMLHTRIDQLAGNQYFYTPRNRPRNRYEQHGTFTGDTR